MLVVVDIEVTFSYNLKSFLFFVRIVGLARFMICGQSYKAHYEHKLRP